MVRSVPACTRNCPPSVFLLQVIPDLGLQFLEFLKTHDFLIWHKELFNSRNVFTQKETTGHAYFEYSGFQLRSGVYAARLNEVQVDFARIEDRDHFFRRD